MRFKPRLSLKKPGTGNTARLRSEPWHAVEIRFEPKCVCDAARATAGRRYLATEAPLLPLRDCDRSDQCQCRYRHFGDRRRGPRRKTDGAPPSDCPSNATDRRRQNSRREEDAIVDYADENETVSSPLEDTYYDYVNKSTFE